MEAFAKAYAIDVMDEHGLVEKGWTFEWSRAYRVAGTCSHYNKVIQMSLTMLPSMNRTDIRETILHEVAHAIVGPGHGHDYVWRAACKRIGGDGNRCHSIDTTDLAPIIGTCGNGHSHKAFRMTQGMRNGYIVCTRGECKVINDVAVRRIVWTRRATTSKAKVSRKSMPVPTNVIGEVEGFSLMG